MLILMAGLPGAGKSTLCRALAAELGGTVIDKDQVRSALFDPKDIEYSTEQDEFCMRVMLKVAGYIFRKDPSRRGCLYGRTFSSRDQPVRATGFSPPMWQPWRLISHVSRGPPPRAHLANDA